MAKAIQIARKTKLEIIDEPNETAEQYSKR